MKTIPHEAWLGRIAPMHLPNQFSEPIKRVYSDWLDEIDPLGSLLEVFKWAFFVKDVYGILASVFVGQIILESDNGKRTDCLIGIKASKKDIEKGTFRRWKTREVVTKDQIAALGEDFISIEKTYPDGKNLVRCYQLFHYEEGLTDDFELHARHYMKYKPWRSQHLATPEDFLKNVTQAAPRYATDKEYPEKCMAKINKYKLQEIDIA